MLDLLPTLLLSLDPCSLKLDTSPTVLLLLERWGRSAAHLSNRKSSMLDLSFTLSLLLDHCSLKLDGSPILLLLLEHLPYVCLLLSEEYYTHHRKPNEKFDYQSTSVDLIVLRLIINNAIVDLDSEAFRTMFNHWVNERSIGHYYELDTVDELAEFKALVLLVAFALMNVQDNEADENDELIPFLNNVHEDPFFASSLGALSALLFNMSEFFVSIRRICTLLLWIDFLTVLLCLFSAYWNKRFCRKVAMVVWQG